MIIKSTIRIALKIAESQLKRFTELNTIVVSIETNKVIVQGEDGKHYIFSGGSSELKIYEKIIIPRKYLTRVNWKRKLGL